MPSEFAFRDRWKIIGSSILPALTILTIHISNTFILDQLGIQGDARAGISVFSQVIPDIIVILLGTRYLIDGLFKRNFIVHEDRVVYSKAKHQAVIAIETIARIEIIYRQWFVSMVGGSVYSILRIHQKMGKPLEISVEPFLLRFPASYSGLVDALEALAKERGIPFDTRIDSSYPKYTKEQEIDQIQKYRHPRDAWRSDKKLKLRLRISQAICIIMGAFIIAFFIAFAILGENDVTRVLFIWAIMLFIMWPFSFGAVMYYKYP